MTVSNPSCPQICCKENNEIRQQALLAASFHKHPHTYTIIIKGPNMLIQV